jgi:hypothetical protein
MILDLAELSKDWSKEWSLALGDWSNFVQLTPPTWCFSTRDEKAEGLTQSFAMIRLNDHAIVISLRQVAQLGLEKYGREILAHEIGHHVYCPGDLADNARLIARTRRGLPSLEDQAPMVSNLYADLLLNNFLQEQGRPMHEIYQKLKQQGSRLWDMYMRTYELLWNLPAATLTTAKVSPQTDQDAMLASRIVRIYAKDWLAGAGRFACLCLPYLQEQAEETGAAASWLDTTRAGTGGSPTGLSEIDEDEESGNIHPAEDPLISGLPLEEVTAPATTNGTSVARQSGLKSFKSYRTPAEYTDIMRAAGSDESTAKIVARYYKERALPYLVPFPSSKSRKGGDPMPEGLDVWEVGTDLADLDWSGTISSSPVIIPGVTTKERLMGVSEGAEENLRPHNLYLGIDCSGSMSNPATTLSYPALAGAVMTLSALRSGASVMSVLSGHPGLFTTTDGFIRSEQNILNVLLGYLGTGYAFGIEHLAKTFHKGIPLENPAHIVVVSDTDMFSMLDSDIKTRKGWDIAKEAADLCGGTANFVLQISDNWLSGSTATLDKMKAHGWKVHIVNSMEGVLQFAKFFSQLHYKLNKTEAAPK